MRHPVRLFVARGPGLVDECLVLSEHRRERWEIETCSVRAGNARTRHPALANTASAAFTSANSARMTAAPGRPPANTTLASVTWSFAFCSRALAFATDAGTLGTASGQACAHV